jgi:hypothetical protein
MTCRQLPGYVRVLNAPVLFRKTITFSPFPRVFCLGIGEPVGVQKIVMPDRQADDGISRYKGRI